MSFVHLHVHSHYSLLDGLSRPEQIVKTAKQHGSPAVALTDHGVLYGAVEFYKAAKKEGVKPIIGCEMYITNDHLKKDANNKSSNHLLLLAKDEDGYKNLMQLVTKAHLDGFYYKPRIDHSMLKAHSKGLIATSSCLQGEIPIAVANNDVKAAEVKLADYLEIFGSDNFFMEVQHHPTITKQAEVNKGIFALADKHGLPIVATNDCHYVKAEDRDAHDILVCIQTGRTIHDQNRMRYTSDHCIKSPEEMARIFKERPDAIANTLAVAEKIDLEIPLGLNLLPRFPTPDGKASEDYLRELCLEGLHRRYTGENKEEALKRLDYELSVITEMGFSDYFLIVWDFINFAKSQDIVVGPGRGSAAGALIAYVLGITAIDPLKYGLIFERFLNPARVSMPDIDIDFADLRRQEIIDYVKNKYGNKNVAQVITFGTMAAKAAVKDVGRAMGYPYSEVDEIAKKMPPPVFGKHPPIEKSVVEHPELQQEYDKNPRAKALLDNAMKLEGTIRNAGTHACAVIIAEKELTEYTPLQFASGKDDTVVTQYSMKPLEDIGLLKMDFLGLRNLTILETTLKIIKAKHDVDIDLADLPESDEKAFKLLAEGKTTGVFQLESGGMKRYLRELKPTQIEDIIAMNALYRPGPMQYIPDYIQGKHDPENVKYQHPVFEEVLNETYGVCVYQEQLMLLARTFAGFTLSQADILRKAVGKKIPELLAEQRVKFVEGAVAEGHDQEFAETIFRDVIEPFAGYGFNKSHAACYAMIAYQTAYLKAHYPTEFMAALLTADQNNTDRVVIDLQECEVLGLKVLPPDINESRVDFTALNNGVIRFGLAAIKGVGEATVQEIINERKNGKFESLENFVKRVPVKLLNKKNLESLAYSGALDIFGDRQQIAQSVDEITTFAKLEQTVENEDQMDIFGMMDKKGAEVKAAKLNLPNVPELTLMQKLKLEKKYLGLFVSDHPLKGFAGYFASRARLIGSFGKKDVGEKVSVYGLIIETKKIVTKKGDSMMILKLEDPSGVIEAVIFPRTYAKHSANLVEDKVLSVEAKLESRNDQMQLVIMDLKVHSLDSIKQRAEMAGLYDRKENVEAYYEQKPTSVDSDSVSVVPESVVPHLEEISLSDGGVMKGFPLNENELNSSVFDLKAKDESFLYKIYITKDVPKENLAKLKELLKANPGTVAVELSIEVEPKKYEKISLKSGILLDANLDKQIKALIDVVKN